MRIMKKLWVLPPKDRTCDAFCKAERTIEAYRSWALTGGAGKLGR